MDNHELNEELKKWKSSGALGVFPGNQLPLSIQPGTGLIVNTAPVGTEGQHWLAMFRDHHDGVLEIFDTYGLTVNAYPWIKQSLLKMSDNDEQIRRNVGQIQSMQSDSCGIYCLLFLLLRLSNIASMQTIVKNIFSENLVLNDCIALYWLLHQFEVNYNNLTSVSSIEKCNKYF